MASPFSIEAALSTPPSLYAQDTEARLPSHTGLPADQSIPAYCRRSFLKGHLILLNAIVYILLRERNPLSTVMVTSAIFLPAVSNNSLFSSEFQLLDKNPGSTGIIRAWSLTASASKSKLILRSPSWDSIESTVSRLPQEPKSFPLYQLPASFHPGISPPQCYGKYSR